MKLLSSSHCSSMRARHHRAGWLVSLSALLGACSLDTVPESTPSRAALEAESSEVEAESSSLDAPSELPDPRSVAGAPAPTPTQASQPAAAVIPAPEAPKREPEPEAAPTPAPSQDKPMAAAAPKSEEEVEPERPVDTSGCKPGDYEGVIAGTVNFGPLEVSTLTGRINLRLVADKQNKNLLRVQQGRVEGIDLNRAVFIADITGEVDCSTGELVQSEVERGTYEDTNEVIKIGFTGAAEGRYSANPPALLGTWIISDDSTLLAGQGTWTTTLTESRE